MSDDDIRPVFRALDAVFEASPDGATLDSIAAAAGTSRDETRFMLQLACDEGVLEEVPGHPPRWRMAESFARRIAGEGASDG